MRIVLTGLLSTFALGAEINLGWCPEPSNLGAPIGSYSGADGAAHVNAPPPPAPIPWEFDPHNPENMTRSERLQMVGREKAAGRLKTDQELKNFLATGNPAKSWTPPEQKPLVKPSNMSDEQWKKFQAAHPRSPPPDYVRGTPITPLLMPGDLPRTMEQNAKAQGGTLTDLPGAVPIPPPPPAKTTTTATPPERHKSVTKLGVHPTQMQPAARLSTTTAIDRLGSSHGASAGSKTTMRTGGTAPVKAQSPAPGMSALDRMTGVSSSGAGNTGAKSNTRSGAGHGNTPQMVPRNFITLPAQRGQDTFRQPK